MAFKTIQKTLTGGNDQLTTTHIPCRGLLIFNDAANTGTSVLIGDKNISASNYGYNLAKGGSTPMIAGSGANTFNLEEVWFRGSAADVIRVLYLS